MNNLIKIGEGNLRSPGKVFNPKIDSAEQTSDLNAINYFCTGLSLHLRLLTRINLHLPEIYGLVCAMFPFLFSKT